MALTSTAKKSIDLLVSTLLATLVAFFLFKKKKSPQYFGIAAVVSFVIFYILTSQVTKALRDRELTPEKVNVPKDVAGDLEKNFDAAKWAKDFYDDIYCKFCFRKTELYASAMRLSNASLTLTYNYWLDNYYSKDNETLTAALEGETFGIGLFNTAAGDGPNLIARLKALNLR